MKLLIFTAELIFIYTQYIGNIFHNIDDDVHTYAGLPQFR